jgi:hypothetical protein
MSLGVGGLLGAVELGVVVLPGAHGAPATVAEVPFGEADAVVVLDPVVELVVPLFVVADVEGVLVAVVDVPMLPLLEGVHGATVVEVPVCV